MIKVTQSKMIRPAQRCGSQSLRSQEKMSYSPAGLTSEIQEAFFMPHNWLLHFACFIDPGEKWGAVNHIDLSLAGSWGLCSYWTLLGPQKWADLFTYKTEVESLMISVRFRDRLCKTCSNWMTLMVGVITWAYLSRVQNATCQFHLVIGLCLILELPPESV